MQCAIGEILLVDFDGYQYNLAIIIHEGVPSAVFVTYNDIDDSWTGMEIPHIFRKFTQLLEGFTRALKDSGYTLLTVTA